MKIIAINGSTHSSGNTHRALEVIQEDLTAAGHEVEIIDLAQGTLNPCHACYKCKGTMKCVQDDAINAIFEKISKADGVILGSPVYFSNVSSRMAMFIERTGIMSRRNDNVLAGKIGASVAIARRAGHNMAYAMMNFYFGIAEMPIVSSSYWNVILAKAPGDVDKDTEGMTILKNLAKNMDNMLKKLR